MVETTETNRNPDIEVDTLNGADVANAAAETVPVAQGNGTLAMEEQSGGGGASTADLPAEKLRETADYLQEPKPVQFNDGTLLVIYRRADTGAHGIDSSGRLVAQRSTDGGETWGAEITVKDDAGDNRQPSLVYDEDSDRLTVLYRSYDSGNTLEGLFKISTTDTGETWGAESQVTTTTYPAIATFGDYIQTSNGLMVAVITDDSGTRVIEALFSTDGAQTFGNATEVIRASQVSTNISEPVPWSATEDKVALQVRNQDAAPGEALQYVVRSDDGGSTWGSTIYEINPFDNGYRSYLYAKRAYGNQLIGVQCERISDTTDGVGPLWGFQIPASVAWDDPSLIDSDSQITKFKLPDAFDLEDWGYAEFVPVGDGSQELFVTWMDNDDTNRNPDIWQANYAVGDVEIGTTTSGSPTTTNTRAELGTSQSLPDSTFTKVELDTVNFGTDFDTTNNEYVVPSDGIYSVGAQVQFGVLSDGVRAIITLTQNGSTINRFDDAATGEGITVGVSDVRQFNSGDTIALEAFQDSGGSVTLDPLTRTNMRVFKIE